MFIFIITLAHDCENEGACRLASVRLFTLFFFVRSFVANGKKCGSSEKYIYADTHTHTHTVGVYMANEFSQVCG